MKNVFLIPTDKSSDIFYIASNFYVNNGQRPLIEPKAYYNIYITSSEKPSEGEWALNTGNNEVIFVTKIIDGVVYHKPDRGVIRLVDCIKILLSTDSALIAGGVQDIDDEFVEWLIKNPECNFVQIHYIKDEYYVSGYLATSNLIKYKIIIPKRHEATELENHECIQDISQELSLEAKRYAKSKSSSESFQDTHIRDFVAGANSNFVKAQNIQAQIDCLQRILDKTSHLSDDGPTRYFVLMNLQSLRQKLNNDGK